MKKSNIFLIKRFGWYLAGIILFFAPFAYYQKAIASIINVKASSGVHSLCLRIPILNLFTGKGVELISVASISVLLLFLSTFLFGAIFCGRFCAAGAFPEYLSRILPDKYKIDWSKIVNTVPIRYGFLAGFLITPFLAGSIACSFCNLSFMQRLVSGGFWGNLGVIGSTAIITGLIWIVFLGIFTKGGRGYCNFLCPIGAVSGLIQSIGSRFKKTFKLKYASDKCVSCTACVKTCPMGSLEKTEEGISHQIHNCITCRQCEATCPTGAISYGTGKSGWNEKKSAETEKKSDDKKVV